MEAAFWSADPTVVNIWSFLEKPASPAVPAPWHSSCVILGRLTDLVLFGFLTCKELLWFAPRGVLVRNTWENPRRVLSAGPGTGNCAVILSTFLLCGHSRPGEMQGEAGIRPLRFPQSHHKQDLIWLWVWWQGRGRGPWPGWPLSSHGLQEATVCCSAVSKEQGLLTPPFPSR